MVDQQQATSNEENNNAVIDDMDSLKSIIDKLRRVVEGIKSPWPEESWPTFVLWILSIIIDPLGLYVPRINDEKKLLDFDKSFLFIILALYVVFYIFQFSTYIYKFIKGEVSSSSTLWWIFIVVAPIVPIATNAVLQVLLFHKATKNIRASIFSVGMAVFLILYLLRVLGIYRLFIATALRKSAILRIVINLLLYFYGGHLFGGLWYFFAVWKKMQCWSKACISHGECYYQKRRFIITSGDNTFLDDMCFIKTEDTTNDLGIFKDALESHIVEGSNYARKLLYCLRWGVQNLSGFGQSLGVSTHAWENIFVLVIAVYGMATFTFFIGNMQNLLKSSTSKSKQKIRWTHKDLEKWSPFQKLSDKDKKLIVKKCKQCNWPQTGVVNVKNLLSNLPSKDFKDDIKRILCSRLLNKVGEFRTWSDELLHELCKYAKRVSYKKNTQIVQNGSPIDEMLFVVEGKLRIYSPHDASFSHLEADGYCGQELVDLFKNDRNSSMLPISTKTIQVVERVDAFAIMSYDLQNVFIKRPAPPRTN